MAETEIEPEALAERLAAEDLQLLDVREDWERAICLLPGSVEVPMQRIPDSLDRLDRDRPVVTICHHGGRSLQVALWLNQQGFDAISLVGGLDQWAARIDPSMTRY